MSRKTRSPARRAARNRFRVIAGSWRGRQLSFADGAGIRPTPDRVRETLFNWLQPVVRGSVCLDLFAGSGALGLEALSRGAGKVTFVESNAEACRILDGQLKKLGAHGEVVCRDAFDFLLRNTDTFDIAFLDPPYNQNLLTRAFAELAGSGALRSDASVYLESGVSGITSVMPKGWRLRRQGKAGQVRFGLAVAEPAQDQVGG